MKITKRNKRIKRTPKPKIDHNLFITDEFHSSFDSSILLSANESILKPYAPKRFIGKQYIVHRKKGKPKIFGRTYYEDGIPVEKIPQKFLPKQVLRKQATKQL